MQALPAVAPGRRVPLSLERSLPPREMDFLCLFRPIVRHVSACPMEPKSRLLKHVTTAMIRRMETHLCLCW